MFGLHAIAPSERKHYGIVFPPPFPPAVLAFGVKGDRDSFRFPLPVFAFLWLTLPTTRLPAINPLRFNPYTGNMQKTYLVALTHQSCVLLYFSPE